MPHISFLPLCISFFISALALIFSSVKTNLEKSLETRFIVSFVLTMIRCPGLVPLRTKIPLMSSFELRRPPRPNGTTIRASNNLQQGETSRSAVDLVSFYQPTSRQPRAEPNLLSKDWGSESSSYLSMPGVRGGGAKAAALAIDTGPSGLLFTIPA